MGVRRAVEIAEKEAAKAADATDKTVITDKTGAIDKTYNYNVYTLGPLIHNPKVLADLNSLGVKIIDDISLTNVKSSLPVPDCSLSAVIIRTHGVHPDIEDELRRTGFSIVDATCPKVKQSQLKTQELTRDGIFLFLAGEEKHAEITGLFGFASHGYIELIDSRVKDDQSRIKDGQLYTKDNKFCVKDDQFCKVVGSTEEAQSAALALFNINKNAKTALIGQTTISENEYANIGIAIKKYFPSLTIVNSICAATTERQNALRELLPLVDAVIIAGGNESANTRCLYSIAKESGRPCVLAQSSLDVPLEFHKLNTIGICAGASTPDSVIDEIEKKLLGL